jgi:hypothetical protein
MDSKMDTLEEKEGKDKQHKETEPPISLSCRLGM